MLETLKLNNDCLDKRFLTLLEDDLNNDKPASFEKLLYIGKQSILHIKRYNSIKGNGPKLIDEYDRNMLNYVVKDEEYDINDKYNRKFKIKHNGIDFDCDNNIYDQILKLNDHIYTTSFLFYPMCDAAHICFYAPLETCQFIADQIKHDDRYQYAINDSEIALEKKITRKKKYADWKYITQDCGVFDEIPKEYSKYRELFMNKKTPNNKKIFEMDIEDIDCKKFELADLLCKIFNI